MHLRSAHFEQGRYGREFAHRPSSYTPSVTAERRCPSAFARRHRAGRAPSSRTARRPSRKRCADRGQPWTACCAAGHRIDHPHTPRHPRRGACMRCPILPTILLPAVLAFLHPFPLAAGEPYLTAGAIDVAALLPPPAALGSAEELAELAL